MAQVSTRKRGLLALWHNHPFHTHLATLFTAMVFVACAAIVWANYVQGRNIVLAAAERLFDRIHRETANEMVTLRADITSLERQRGFLHRLQELRTNIRALTEERGHLQTQIEADVEQQNSDKTSLFSSIRLFFSEIVEDVIDRKALLSVSPNQLGHLEFKAEILDESGNATSADLGHTYRKLLCIAFDMAVLRAHLNDKFPRFVYHDGVFESLDDRKKESLLAAIRRYADLGIQPVITLIDSDLPNRNEKAGSVFDENEIVLTLHDEDERGRLFKLRAW